MDEPLVLRLYLPKHLSEKLKNAFRAENSIVFLCIAMNKLKVFSKLCSSVLSAYANALGLQNMLCFDKVLNGCKTGFQLKAICNKTRILETFLSSFYCQLKLWIQIVVEIWGLSVNALSDADFALVSAWEHGSFQLSVIPFHCEASKFAECCLDVHS